MKYLLKKLVFCILVFIFCLSLSISSYAIKGADSIKINKDSKYNIFSDNTKTEIGGSARIDLMGRLADLTGPAYSEVLKHTVKTDIGTINFYESKVFHIFESAKSPWYITTGIIALGLIVIALGLISKNKFARYICFVAVIIASILYMIPKGELIDNYHCIVKISRYATVKNSEYIYNSTEKIIEYNAYENVTQNNTERAYVDARSQTITYEDSEIYFNDYAAQVNDIQNMFAHIGQKP